MFAVETDHLARGDEPAAVLDVPDGGLQLFPFLELQMESSRIQLQQLPAWLRIWQRISPTVTLLVAMVDFLLNLVIPDRYPERRDSCHK